MYRYLAAIAGYQVSGICCCYVHVPNKTVLPFLTFWKGGLWSLVRSIYPPGRQFFGFQHPRSRGHLKYPSTPISPDRIPLSPCHTSRELASIPTQQPPPHHRPPHCSVTASHFTRPHRPSICSLFSVCLITDSNSLIISAPRLVAFEILDYLLQTLRSSLEATSRDPSSYRCLRALERRESCAAPELVASTYRDGCASLGWYS